MAIGYLPVIPMPRILMRFRITFLEDSQPIPILLVLASKHTSSNQRSTACSGDLNQTCGLAVALEREPFCLDRFAPYLPIHIKLLQAVIHPLQ